jgi:hypothetical protein
MNLHHRVLEADGHRINQGQVGQSPRVYQDLVTRFLTYHFSTHNAGPTQYECTRMKPLLALTKCRRRQNIGVNKILALTKYWRRKKRRPQNIGVNKYIHQQNIGVDK